MKKKFLVVTLAVVMLLTLVNFTKVDNGNTTKNDKIAYGHSGIPKAKKEGKL